MTLLAKYLRHGRSPVQKMTSSLCQPTSKRCDLARICSSCGLDETASWFPVWFSPRQPCFLRRWHSPPRQKSSWIQRSSVLPGWIRVRRLSWLRCSMLSPGIMWLQDASLRGHSFSLSLKFLSFTNVPICSLALGSHRPLPSWASPHLRRIPKTRLSLELEPCERHFELIHHADHHGPPSSSQSLLSAGNAQFS